MKLVLYILVPAGKQENRFERLLVTPRFELFLVTTRLRINEILNDLFCRDDIH